MIGRRLFLFQWLGAAGLVITSGASAGDARRRMRFAIRLSNPTANTIENQQVWFYGPMGKTGTQELSGLRVSVPHQLSTDLHGQTIVALAVPSIAPLATRIVTVTADLQLRDVPLAEPDDGGAWLGEERYVEVNDPAIRALAQELHRGEAAATAKAIYDWVRQNVQFSGYVADDLGAREALKTLRGDCTEFAYLCAALARANGIPARVAGGYVVDSDVTPRASDFHNWAQVHVRGSWRTVDAQKEQWWNTPCYVAFHVVTAVGSTNPIGTAHRYRATEPLQVAF